MEGSNRMLDDYGSRKLHDARILIVDDQELNVVLLEGILDNAGFNKVVSTTDSTSVVPLKASVNPDLILLDLMMPDMDGFEVMGHLKPVIPRGEYLPILVLTANITKEAKIRALSMGAKDFLIKPFDQTEVLLRIQNLLITRFLHLQLQNQNEQLEEKVRERTAELEEAQIEMLERLAAATEYRDDVTGLHIRRVGNVAALLARELGLPQSDVDLIRRAALLHDVGKIGIPDSILHKLGRLTPEEVEFMKTHTLIGGRLLTGGRSELTRMAEQIALTHQERWDGSGYPLGLKGEAIPLAGRIVALADVFDALTHERPYKKAWSLKDALAEIRRQSGRQFDPQVVEAFFSLPDPLAEFPGA
jgi:putative two-component system response regulator